MLAFPEVTPVSAAPSSAWSSAGGDGWPGDMLPGSPGQHDGPLQGVTVMIPEWALSHTVPFDFRFLRPERWKGETRGLQFLTVLNSGGGFVGGRVGLERPKRESLKQECLPPLF